MAYLKNTFDADKNYLLTGEREEPGANEPIDVGSGGSASPPAGTGGQDSYGLGSPAPASAGAPTAPEIPTFQTHGNLPSRLFDPVGRVAGEGGETLDEAVSLFRADAGPSRTFESAGGSEAVSDYVTTGDAASTEKTAGLLGAQYEGPGGLDAGTMAGLQNLYQEGRTRKGALQSGSGLQTLVRGSAPGLSSGEARFEAKRLLGDQDYRARAFAPNRELRAFGASLEPAAEKARGFAEQRRGEEEAVGERTRSELTGRKGVIESDLATRIAEVAQQQAGARQAYEAAIGEGGHTLARGRTPLDAVTPFLPEGTAEQFDTPAAQRHREALKEYNRIIWKPEYEALASYDPSTLGISSHGRESHPAEGMDPALEGLHSQRQMELEAVFGTSGPGDARFQDVLPLYDFGVGEYQSNDPTRYLSLDPGLKPSRQNVSSEVQRTQFNRINEMLGSAGRLEEAEPFRAAQIYADVDGYLADEEAYLQAREGALTAQQTAWANTVRKARKKYRKAKSKAKLGNILGGLSLGALAGVNPLGFITPVDLFGIGYDQTQKQLSSTSRDIRRIRPPEYTPATTGAR